MFTLEPLNTPMKLSLLAKILIPICSIALIIGIFFSLCAKSDNGKKVTKICLASILSFFVVFKAVFWIIRIISISTTNSINVSDLPKIFGFEIINFVIILEIVILFLSAFYTKKARFIEFLQQTLIGVGLPVALYNLCRARMIHTQDNLFHIINIQAMLTIIILIVGMLYLIKTKSIKLNITKFWYAIAGYVCLTSLVMTISLISYDKNYSEMTFSSTLYQMGIKVSFPWHLLITIPIFLLISFGIYYLLLIIFKDKLAQPNVSDDIQQKNDFFDIYSFSTKSICCMQGFLILIIISAIVRNPLGTWLGLLSLIPLIMTIFCVLAVFELDKLSDLNDENIFEQRQKLKKSITYLMIGNFIFGLSYVKQLKNERLAIIERKEREERKRLRKLNKQNLINKDKD